MKASATHARTATCTFDISVEGKQHGHLIVPCASEQSALGSVQIPVCVIRNGEGPVITLVAGSRGDEFDGQVALQHLCGSINVDDVQGCLIIAPTLNPSAAKRLSRCSAVDAKDLDCCFPGDESGSFSKQMAAHILTQLIAPAELVIELKSGGASTLCTPLASVQFNAHNTALQESCEQSMIAFGAPYSARLIPTHTNSLASTLQVQEKKYVGVHLGGGASVNPRHLEIANIGCLNALIQAGALRQELVLRSTRMLEVSSEKNYVYAPTSGLLAMSKDAGDEVYMGSPIASIIDAGNTGTQATTIKANRNGILMARHHSGYIEQGDCVAILADEVQR